MADLRVDGDAVVSAANRLIAEVGPLAVPGPAPTPAADPQVDAAVAEFGQVFGWSAARVAAAVTQAATTAIGALQTIGQADEWLGAAAKFQRMEQ